MQIRSIWKVVPDASWYSCRVLYGSQSGPGSPGWVCMPGWISWLRSNTWVVMLASMGAVAGRSWRCSWADGAAGRRGWADGWPEGLGAGWRPRSGGAEVGAPPERGVQDARV